MKQSNYSCSLPIGSVTEALKASRALSSASVYAEVIKTDKQKRGGCIYGISFTCAEERKVRSILEARGIRIKTFYDDIP